MQGSRRRLRRIASLVLGFGLKGYGVYYAIVAGYAVLVVVGVWLFSRPGWLPVLAGWVVLIDGLAAGLILLYRWSMSRAQRARPPDRDHR